MTGLLRYVDLVVAGDRLAALGSGLRTVVLFTWKDGREIARIAAAERLRPNAWTIAEDAIVIADFHSGARSIVIADGTSRWSFRDLRRADTISFLPGARKIALAKDQHLRLLDPGTGRWRARIRGTRACDLDGAHVLVADDAQVSAIDAAGAIAWQRPREGSALACHGAHGLALVAGDRLDALDAATGAPRWTFAPGAGERISRIGAVDDGIAVIATGRAAPARLVVLDLDGGVRSDREIRGSVLRFVDRDHVASNDGTVRRISDLEVTARF